jgi:hypothetical protein
VVIKRLPDDDLPQPVKVFSFLGLFASGGLGAYPGLAASHYARGRRLRLVTQLRDCLGLYNASTT